MELSALIGIVIIGGAIFAAAWLGRPRYNAWRERRRGRWAARTMMDTALLRCARCILVFEADDAVVLAVPYAERGPVVRMGDELLYHEACHPDVIDSDPV